MTVAAATRFDGIAENYLASPVHRSSPTVDRLKALLALGPKAALVDIGCGPGHLGLALRPLQGRLVAVDPSAAMLQIVEDRARELGRGSVTTLRSFSGRIELPSGSFDAAVSRLAAHHFPSLRASVREMARLVAPGGLVGLIDLEGYEDRELALFNDSIERLHDPTHVWSWSLHEMSDAIEDAGLELVALERGWRESKVGVALEEWCRIAESPPGAADAITERLRAEPHLTAALGIEIDGDTFRVPVRTVVAVARKSGGTRLDGKVPSRVRTT